MRSLSIYIHIPFCVRKCFYCDFLSFPVQESVKEQYVRALCTEIREQACHYKEYNVATVFLGGGTPSLLSGSQVQTILSCVYENYTVDGDVEITMEMNPGTVTGSALAVCRAAGVNRVSLGLQSADDGELRRLGRIHTWDSFLQSYRLCRKMGFDNINIDIMSALPGQTLASCTATLQRVAALEPEHISAYSLIIEEGTPFYEKYGGRTEEKETVQPSLPDEEADRAMYEMTKQVLAMYGYGCYEISNYAKPGKECAHNCVYWTRGAYVGFGLGAASMVDNVRWSNVRELDVYLDSSTEAKKRERHRLSVAEQMEETMFLGLRMSKGVSRAEFMHRFGRPMEEVYGAVLKKHIELGMMEISGDRVRLTDAGVNVSNCVMADFLL